MRTIEDIYDAYDVPPELRLHMLRVAAVGAQILAHWHGPRVDDNMVTRVLLLHDIGNIVKMEFDDLPAEDLRAVARWRNLKDALIRHYGRDDHAISRSLAQEVGLSDAELDLMDAKVFVRNDTTLASADYGRKIAAYSDQRVAPTGVLPLLARLREAQERYSNKARSRMSRPDLPFLIDCATKIEDQLFVYCSLRPEDITDDSITPWTAELLHFTL